MGTLGELVAASKGRDFQSRGTGGLPPTKNGPISGAAFQEVKVGRRFRKGDASSRSAIRAGTSGMVDER